MKVQVRDVDPKTNQSVGTIKDLDVLNIVDPPKATGNGVTKDSGIRVKANLNANAEVPPVEVDYNNVTPEMYNFQTTVTAYDSKGNKHPITVAFRKIPDKPADIEPLTGQPIPNTEIKNNWQWIVLVPGEDLAGGNPNLKKAVGGGFVEFLGDGKMTKEYTVVIERTPQPSG